MSIMPLQSSHRDRRHKCTEIISQLHNKCVIKRNSCMHIAENEEVNLLLISNDFQLIKGSHPLM